MDIPTLFLKLSGYASCNCPEDDYGVVRYHSNCNRHMKPLLRELNQKTDSLLSSHAALLGALKTLVKQAETHDAQGIYWDEARNAIHLAESWKAGAAGDAPSAKND